MEWDWVAFWDFAKTTVAPVAAIVGGFAGTVWAATREDQRAARARIEAEKLADEARLDRALDADRQSFAELIEASINWMHQLGALKDFGDAVNASDYEIAMNEKLANEGRVREAFRLLSLAFERFQARHPAPMTATHIERARSGAEVYMDRLTQDFGGALPQDGYQVPWESDLRSWIAVVRSLGLSETDAVR